MPIGELRAWNSSLGQRYKYGYTGGMFERKQTIFFLTHSLVRMASVRIKPSEILREERISIEDIGLARAFEEGRKRMGNPEKLIVPEEYLYVTRLELPNADARHRSGIERVIESVFPETLEKLAWDYECVGETQGKTLVEVSGLVKEFGQILSAALKSANLSIASIIPESYALARLIEHPEPVLAIHESETGWIVFMVAGQRVVSSLFWDHVPTEKELRDFLEHTRKEKQVTAKQFVFSSVTASGEGWPELGLTRLPLDRALNVFHGAALIRAHSHRDEDRLSLPVRPLSAWYSRWLHKVS